MSGEIVRQHGEHHRPPGWNGATDPGGPDPLRWLAKDFALLAIPDGQTIADGSLDVITNFNREQVVGTAMSVNAVTGLITFNEAGTYDAHSWAEMDDQGAWVVVEGPVFQGGQDFQDIGNGLLVHVTHPNFTVLQHMTRIVVFDTGTNLSPASLNLQVLHERGSNDDLVNGGISVVRR